MFAFLKFLFYLFLISIFFCFFKNNTKRFMPLKEFVSFSYICKMLNLYIQKNKRGTHTLGQRESLDRISFLFALLKLKCYHGQLFSTELENRLLSRFDNASQKRELAVMAECAKILSQVFLHFLCFVNLSVNLISFYLNNMFQN